MNENEPFFREFYEADGTFIGIGGGKHSDNCYCAEHDQPPEESTESEQTTESEPVTEPAQTTEAETTARETAPAETTPIEPRETEETKKKRLIPWGFS